MTKGDKIKLNPAINSTGAEGEACREVKLFCNRARPCHKRDVKDVDCCLNNLFLNGLDFALGVVGHGV